MDAANNSYAVSNELPGLVTERELATWLGVGQRTIMNWRFKGKFPPPIKLGIRRAPTRWLVSDILDWLEEQKTPPKTFKNAA